MIEGTREIYGREWYVDANGKPLHEKASLDHAAAMLAERVDAEIEEYFTESRNAGPTD